MMLTSMLLVCGAMTMTWICDTITESGFGTMLDILVTWLAMIILLIFPANLYTFILRPQFVSPKAVFFFSLS